MARAAALLLLSALALAGCPRGRGPGAAPAAATLRPGAAHPGGRAALEQAAADPDPSVRGLALAALVRVDPAPAGGAFGPRAAYDPSPWVQRQLVEALGDRGAEPESGALLTDLATRPGVEPYVACAAALRAPPGPALSAALAERLRSAPRWTRPPCALAGLRHGVEGAAAVGNAALAEGDIPLSLGFLADLWADDARALQPGLEAALPLVEPELAPPLAALLLAWGAPGAAAALDAAGADGGTVAQVGVVDAVAGLPGPLSTAKLQALAGGPGGPAQEAARLHLAARGLGYAAELLAAAGDREDRERRARALLPLGGALCQPVPDKRLARAAPALLRAGIYDEDERAQIAALQAVGRCGAGAVKDHELEALLVDPEAEGRARAEAARALLLRAAG